MKRLAFAVLAAATLVGCDNGGASSALGVAATGTVYGRVFYDINGSRSFDAADPAYPGARVTLRLAGAADTLRLAATGADGSFRFVDVPVGSYLLAVDSAGAADSARPVAPGPTVVSVLPGDSVEFIGGVSDPSRSIAEVRGLPLGARALVRGIALHALAVFSDTTLHLVDTSGALRASRVRPPLGGLTAGDSIVLRGRVALRAGQRVLDDVTVAVVSPTFIPTAPLLTTAQASSGGPFGSLDAALVRLANVLVSDTATVAGDLRLTVSDGTGPVVVVLDRTADPGFRPPLPAGLYVPGNRFDLTGILVPTGTGNWRLKPRSSLDLTRR